MRIGLLRHFPVTEDFPSGWRTAAELQTWRERYEAAETTAGPFDLGGVDWRACIASDLPRARVTAQAVFKGEIESTALLREVQFATLKTGAFRLPISGWKWLFQLAWLTGHSSQRACRDDFQQRVQQMAERLSKSDQDILVVSHAGMMAYLSKELRRRGFSGPKLRIAKHATAYVYDRK